MKPFHCTSCFESKDLVDYIARGKCDIKVNMKWAVQWTEISDERYPRFENWYGAVMICKNKGMENGPDPL